MRTENLASRELQKGWKKDFSMAGYLISNTRSAHSCQSLVISLLKMAVIITPILRRIEKVDKYFNPGFGDKKKEKSYEHAEQAAPFLTVQSSHKRPNAASGRGARGTSQRLCPLGGVRGQRPHKAQCGFPIKEPWPR